MQQRGSKYDARTKEQALALIASGVSITNAAKQLQIPKSTVADWWNTQGDADEDAVAARREARRASILKCGKIVDKALAALDKRVAAAGREARDMDEGLKVLKKAAKDGVIGLSEDEVKSLQKIVQDYTGIGLRELTTDAGVDLLSLGGTKIGAMLAEAVVVLSPERVAGVTFLRKQSMQLASKMRFVSAQLLALFEGDLWRRNAEHANAMARRLADGVADIEGIRLDNAVAANAAFPVLPREVSERLMERFRFYFWDETTGQVRWMCAWDTTESDVDTFLAAVREEMARDRG